jgi:SAM-dependent methyltransferase
LTEQALYLATNLDEYAIGLGKGERPTPPPELMEYGESADRHLETGQQNVTAMLSALEDAQFSWTRCQRALEFGCSNGKLVRWLEPFATNREIWGVDVQADKVMWAMKHLSPPFRFATTTTVPHLPFADGHFDLIFAGSVFTHLGELHVAWFAELARVLAQDGFVYITLHDETAIRIAGEEPSHAAFSEQIERSAYTRDLAEGDFGFISMAPYGKAMLSQIMMSESYVRHVAQPLTLVGTFPRAYAGFQTGYVFTTA